MRRMLMAVAAVSALALPATLVTVGLAGTAGAAAGTASCSKLKVNLTTSTATITKCSDKPNTGGKGTIPFSGIVPPGGSGTITWNKTGTTNITVTVTSVTSTCGAGTSQFDVSGSVTSDTGKASSIAVGPNVSATICVSSAGVPSLKKKTKFIV